MREYYEAELRLLHESAQEFAKAYPEQAGMLNLNELKDRDPYIERLLEGMAYLTAQIRQHIDDDIPEISENLLYQLWPHFLRPYPSSTIIQFIPRIGQLQQSQQIDKGTILLSAPSGDERVICRFGSTVDVTLNPIRLSRVLMSEPSGGGTVLKFTFQLDSGVFASDIDLSKLKIHIHADPALALLLHHQFTGELQRAHLSFPEQPTVTPYELGSQQSIKASHFEMDASMLPINGRSFHGFHLLQDFFNFREKYMFFTINGIENVTWPDSTSQFDIDLKIKGVLPQDHSLTKDNFLLHCSPAVNLFEQTSEPINLTHKRSAYPVIADISSREGTEVYSVDKVIGVDAENGEQYEYFPMYTFQHRRKGGRYYYCNRRIIGTGRPETYLSVGGISNFRAEMLSCVITATNGSYPRRYIRENQVSTPSVDFPSYASFKNLTRPSIMYPPPERGRFQWDLISHLSLNYSSLASLEVLHRVLSLYDWSNDEQNSRRVNGIQNIDIESVERIRKGAILRGLEISLTVHEDRYRSISDIHLFGMVLHHFFSMYAAINCFVLTKVNCHPSNKVLKWEPLVGENSPI